MVLTMMIAGQICVLLCVVVSVELFRIQQTVKANKRSNNTYETNLFDLLLAGGERKQQKQISMSLKRAPLLNQVPDELPSRWLFSAGSAGPKHYTLKNTQIYPLKI